MMSDEMMRQRMRLKNDVEYFSRLCLRIYDKDKLIYAPFNFNAPQAIAAAAMREQYARKGYTRAIWLKSRQVGASTMSQAAAFQYTIHNIGAQTFILTNKKEQTKYIFGIAKRYYDYFCQDNQALRELLLPPLLKRNESEIEFDGVRSRYLIGTAGDPQSGRGMTPHFFHGSEFAYWQYGEAILTGVMQGIPRVAGTHVILESTANGTDNIMYDMWRKAVLGKSDFIAIFIPWLKSHEYAYSTPVDGDIELSKEELEFKSAYNATKEQIYFRRAKIIEFSTHGMDGYASFNREYPTTHIDAFNVAKPNQFIPMHLIEQAMRTKHVAPQGLRVMGIDFAGGGNDYNCYALRTGRVVEGVWRWKADDTRDTMGIIIDAIKKHRPDQICCDATGMGGPMSDELTQMFGDVVVPINFATRALNQERYANRRAEMYANLVDFLMDEPCTLPADEDLKKELCAIERARHNDTKGRLLLLSKEEIKDAKHLGHSPDAADAVALTVAQPFLVHQYKELDYTRQDAGLA